VPDFVASRSPTYRSGRTVRGVEAISGVDPFIMQADGKAWLFAQAGLVDGPLPAHYEPQENPARMPPLTVGGRRPTASAPVSPARPGPSHELTKRGMRAPPTAKKAGEQGKERP
jgi:hypothetical protein